MLRCAEDAEDVRRTVQMSGTRRPLDVLHGVVHFWKVTNNFCRFVFAGISYQKKRYLFPGKFIESPSLHNCAQEHLHLADASAFANFQRRFSSLGNVK